MKKRRLYLFQGGLVHDDGYEGLDSDMAVSFSAPELVTCKVAGYESYCVENAEEFLCRQGVQKILQLGGDEMPGVGEYIEIDVGGRVGQDVYLFQSGRLQENFGGKLESYSFGDVVLTVDEPRRQQSPGLFWSGQLVVSVGNEKVSHLSKVQVKILTGWVASEVGEQVKVKVNVL